MFALYFSNKTVQESCEVQSEEARITSVRVFPNTPSAKPSIYALDKIRGDYIKIDQLIKLSEKTSNMLKEKKNLSPWKDWW